MSVNHKDACPCGSGKRYKHCHQPIDAARRRNLLVFGAAVVVVAVAGTLLGPRLMAKISSQGAASLRPLLGGATVGRGSPDAADDDDEVVVAKVAQDPSHVRGREPGTRLDLVDRLLAVNRLPDRECRPTTDHRLPG